MKQVVPIAVGVVLIIGVGVVDGVLTDRWGRDEKLQAAAQRLEKNVPVEVGDWNSTAVEISASQLQQAEAVGHFSRRFSRESNSEEQVSVLALCGPHGPIAVHPPTVCFVGAGWRPGYAPKKREFKDESGKKSLGTFWVTDFTKDVDGVPTTMRTFWGWSNGSDAGWRASNNPRFEFAGSPFLYKLYVTVPVDPNDDDDKTGEDFIRSFLPAIDKAIR
jgi:hypothetical protein